MIWYLFFITVLLLLSGFFSGSETALFAFDPVAAKDLAQKGTGPLAKLYRRIDSFLPTVLFLNLVVNAGINVLATVLTMQHLGGEKYLPITGIVVTVVIVLFAEITPKTLAVRFSSKISYFAALPFLFLVTLFRPVTAPLTRACRFVQRRLPWKPLPIFTAEELKSTIQKGVESQVLGRREGSILENIVTFRKTLVMEFMTPRTEIVYLPINTPPGEIPRKAKLAGFARLPVTKGDDIDSVTGCVHVKELLMSEKLMLEKPGLQRFLRPVYFAPQCMVAGQLFYILRERGIQQSMIVDEYGQVVGLVTLHDLIEELMGTISDEYSPEAPWIARRKENGWIINATCPVTAINEKLGLNLPAGRGRTLGGFLFHLAGHLPSRHEKLYWGGWEFLVQVVRRQRITVVRVTKREKP